VVKHLDDFLVDERVVRGGRAVVVAFGAWQGYSQGAGGARIAERCPHFGVAFGRAETHHDIFGAQDGLEPRAELRECGG
jgi:hypothetical protein